MRFLHRACLLFFGLGVLSLLIASVNELFSLGMFPDGYPAGETNAAGESVGSSYGHFMLVGGIITLVALLLGSYLHYRLSRRYERLAIMMEAMRAQGYQEALQEDEPEL